MVDAVKLRKALAAFLGDDRYRQLVAQVYWQGKLRYWQEQEWGRFITAHPEFAVRPEELAVVLRSCERHGEEWQRRRRAATTTAALVGCLVAGVIHIAIVFVCCLLYVRLYPANGEFLAYLPEMVYISLALCATPLSMLWGARIGVRWAQLRESTTGSKIPAPPQLPPSGNLPPG